MADIALVDAGRSAAKEEGHSTALADEEQIPVCGSYSAKVGCFCKPCILSCDIGAILIHFFLVSPFVLTGLSTSYILLLVILLPSISFARLRP